MTVKTFWTIFIKILGVWLVLDSIGVIPQFISSLVFVDRNDTIQAISITIALLLLTIGIYIAILRLFVFNTSWVIDKLNLDKGFAEDKIDLTVSRSTVLSVAVVVIGGLMFVDSLPQLCKQVFEFVQQQSMVVRDPASGWIIFYLAKTVIGYLIMTNSQLVAGFIDKQSAIQK